jgi:hypothetical protein
MKEVNWGEDGEEAERARGGGGDQGKSSRTCFESMHGKEINQKSFNYQHTNIYNSEDAWIGN